VSEFTDFQELDYDFSTHWEVPRNFLCLKTWTTHHGPGNGSSWLATEHTA